MSVIEKRTGFYTNGMTVKPMYEHKI